MGSAIISVAVPDSVLEKFFVTDYRRLNKGDWFLDQIGGPITANRWTNDISSVLCHLVLTPRPLPLKLPLKFPASLMSVLCAGIAMNSNGIWKCYSVKPIAAGPPLAGDSFQVHGLCMTLLDGFFPDLPKLDFTKWRESWIPKPEQPVSPMQKIHDELQMSNNNLIKAIKDNVEKLADIRKEILAAKAESHKPPMDAFLDCLCAAGKAFDAMIKEDSSGKAT